MFRRNVINLFIDHRPAAGKRDEEGKRGREQNRLLLLRFERRCTGLTFWAHRKSARRCPATFCYPFCVFETSVSPAKNEFRAYPSLLFGFCPVLGDSFIGLFFFSSMQRAFRFERVIYPRLGGVQKLNVITQYPSDFTRIGVKVTFTVDGRRT